METEYLSSRNTENSSEWTAERTAAWESPDYIQRVEDREQEKYLAEWCRRHEERKHRRRGHSTCEK